MKLAEKNDQGQENNEKFENLLDFLKIVHGVDLRIYKYPTLMRRIGRRMQAVDIADYEAYQDYLEVHPEEFSELFNTILINVTSFFRDKETWDYLAKEIIPKIVASKKMDEVIRIWSAGCATGEEVYTVAMLLNEALGEEDFKKRVKIFATDIDEQALAHARRAKYSAKDMEPVPEEFRRKYFEHSGDSYVFITHLRRPIIFGRLDLIRDAHTLMYFNAEAQARILAKFHFGLNDTGFIFLGRAELSSNYVSLFMPVNVKYRILVKIPQTKVCERFLVPEKKTIITTQEHLTISQISLQEACFEIASRAKIILELNGRLAFANRQARKLFGLSPQDIDRLFWDLEVSYCPLGLRSLIEESYSRRSPVIRRKVERILPNGGNRFMDIEITPLLQDEGTPIGLCIVFSDETERYNLQQELERTKRELQSTNEVLVTMNEEFNSSVEELQTTNEELETLNEELQSTNEELSTTNDEFSQRSDDLNLTNALLDSVLESLHRGLVLMDRGGCILAWNHRAEELWGLQATDILGKSFFVQDMGLPVEQLTAPIRKTLDEGKSTELDLEATNRKGKRIVMHMILAPLMESGQNISGAILIMEEIE
jgi:two-component system CheB/CheR fusion protein